MSFPLILAFAAVVLAAVAGVLLVREKDPQRRARALVKLASVAMTVFTVAAVAFIGGYAMDQPGGMTGLMMTLSWFVPMVVLAALAWFRPAGASPLLMALAVVLVAVCVWFALDPAAARSVQDSNGPVVAIGVVALAFPAAVLGLKRSGPAGWLLFAIGTLPLLITVLGRSGPAASLAAASVVPLIAGIAYLVAARLARRDPASRNTLPAPA
jgi:nitrate reductase NapE component